MCRCSALFVVGLLVLVIAVLAASVGFLAPFWLVYKESGVSGFFTTKVLQYWAEGLWGSCYRDNSCEWYFKNDFEKEKSLPDWHKAAQGLFGVGLLLLLVALLIGAIQMCVCCCCKESSSVVSTLGSLCVSAACLIASAIGVFGGYASQQDEFALKSFYWAFFVAIGGAATAVVAAILFFCESCRAHSHSGYHMTRVV